MSSLKRVDVLDEISSLECHRGDAEKQRPCRHPEPHRQIRLLLALAQRIAELQGQTRTWTPVLKEYKCGDLVKTLFEDQHRPRHSHYHQRLSGEECEENSASGCRHKRVQNSNCSVRLLSWSSRRNWM